MRRPLLPPVRPMTRLAKPIPKPKPRVLGAPPEADVGGRAMLHGRSRIIDRIRSTVAVHDPIRSGPC